MESSFRCGRPNFTASSSANCYKPILDYLNGNGKRQKKKLTTPPPLRAALNGDRTTKSRLFLSLALSLSLGFLVPWLVALLFHRNRSPLSPHTGCRNYRSHVSRLPVRAPPSSCLHNDRTLASELREAPSRGYRFVQSV